MRVSILQHVAFEGIGSLREWLASRKAEVALTRLYLGDTLPDPGCYEWLIVMGGPMGVHDETGFPWLAEEKRSILGAIEGGKRVLGICLGAQLIAAALGARVFRNGEREIGWHPVRRVGEGPRKGLAAAIPDGSVVFHWHADTFDLPPGAVGFLSSNACGNQAFHLGERILGIQFHLETTMESARALVEGCAGDLVPGSFVQSKAEILSHPRRFTALRPIMSRVMDVMEGAGPVTAA